MASAAGPRVLEVAESANDTRLDRFLKKRFPRLPPSLIHKLLRKRRVTVNRKRAEANRRLRSGDRVELWTDFSPFEPDPAAALKRAARIRASTAYKRHFRLLHEDEDILVLDKPSGLVVHPSRDHRHGDTLLDLLQAHSGASEGDYRPAFVHRLDRGTSGVLVAAKTREAAKSMERTLRSRLARKVYTALCHGHPSRERGTIELPIQRHETRSGVGRYQAVTNRDTYDAGKVARTDYTVVEPFASTTLLELTIVTGRTHQIRAHLAAVGRPVVGDGDYGNRRLDNLFRHRHDLRRLFLHARELEISHPRDGRRVRFQAPLPRELEIILAELRGNGNG